MAKNAQNLEVEIFWPPSLKKESFKGKVFSISSKNKLGKFDILPKHANFITLISDYLILRTPENKTTKLHFKRGVLEAYKNKVRVFLEL